MAGELKGESMTKKDFNEYQNLMHQKFNWEDKIATINNLIWRKKNEKLKASQQLRLVEDGLRVFFKRKRIELEEKSESSNIL